MLNIKDGDTVAVADQYGDTYWGKAQIVGQIIFVKHACGEDLGAYHRDCAQAIGDVGFEIFGIEIDGELVYI